MPFPDLEVQSHSAGSLSIRCWWLQWSIQPVWPFWHCPAASEVLCYFCSVLSTWNIFKAARDLSCRSISTFSCGVLRSRLHASRRCGLFLAPRDLSLSHCLALILHLDGLKGVTLFLGWCGGGPLSPLNATSYPKSLLQLLNTKATESVQQAALVFFLSDSLPF